MSGVSVFGEGIPSVGGAPWGEFAVGLEFVARGVGDGEFLAVLDDGRCEFCGVCESSEDGGANGGCVWVVVGGDGLLVALWDGVDDFAFVDRGVFVVGKGGGGHVEGQDAVDMGESVHVGANETFAVCQFRIRHGR